MTSSTAKPKKTAKPVSAADRIKTPPFQPTNGITREQISKVIREIMAKRDTPAQG